MKLSFVPFAFLLGTAIADIDPIVIKGSKFFYKSNNTQFYIRGVAYQENYHGSSMSNASDSFIDPLADPASCKRDIPILQELRTNTIRVYAINPHSSHKECMNMLADAGIYVLCDLSDPKHAIDRTSPHWETGLYGRYVDVVDEMAQYTNTLGFFVGNEVANSVTTTNSSAFVKAAVRDMKAYIKHRGHRHIGVGYATNDDAEIRVNMANYFNCDNPDDGVDFWGYNVYSWCGDSSYEGSGYKDRTEQFRNYTAPVFFAEYGCNEVQPRRFTEVDVLYRDPMDQVWSGGVIYMYFQEANNYGLVSVVGGDRVSKLADFDAYSRHIASANPSGIDKESYTSTSTALQECPTINSKWAAATPLPPTPDLGLCDCMTDAASCVVADSLPSSEYGDLFGLVCGVVDCSNIATDSTEGKYGNYSMCGPRQQLNIILDKYYLEKGSEPSACDFGGSAITKKPSRSTGDCNVVTEKKTTTNRTNTVSPKETDTSSGSPCSCTCKFMGMDSLDATRSLANAASNLLSLGSRSLQFGLSLAIGIVAGFVLALL